MNIGSAIAKPVTTTLVVGVITILTLVSGVSPAGASELKGRYCAGAIVTASGKISLIWAQHVSCRTARKVSRPARHISVSNGPYRYRAHGFRCRGQYSDTLTEHVTWKCRRGSRKKVTFYQT